jgi:hypothetical protein
LTSVSEAQSGCVGTSSPELGSEQEVILTLRELALDAPALRDLDPFWTELLVRQSSQELERYLKTCSTHLRVDRPTPDRIVIHRNTEGQDVKLVDAPITKLLSIALFDEQGALQPALQALLDKAPTREPRSVLESLRRILSVKNVAPEGPITPFMELTWTLDQADPDNLRTLFQRIQMRYQLVHPTPRVQPNPNKENA